MTSRSRYVIGLVSIGALTLAVSRGVPEGARSPLVLAFALAIAVQAPLGWWLIRSVGTERFMVAWGIGLAARLALVGGMGLIGVRLLGLGPTTVLVPLAGLLVTLLALEAIVLLLREPGTEVP